MTRTDVTDKAPCNNTAEPTKDNCRTPLTHILERLSPLELPEKEHFESYLRHKWRSNHKPST